MSPPRTILGHRVTRESEAERLLLEAHRFDVSRFMGAPAGKTRPPGRQSSAAYSRSMAWERDNAVERARRAPGYLGPEPKPHERVAALPGPLREALERKPPALIGAIIGALGCSTIEAYVALGRAVPDGLCNPINLALDVIEFGPDGAEMRAKDKP